MGTTTCRRARFHGSAYAHRAMLLATTAGSPRGYGGANAPWSKSSDRPCWRCAPGGLCSVAAGQVACPTPEAAAKAAEAAAKAAWSGKVNSYKALPGARPRGGALPQDGQGRQTPPQHPHLAPTPAHSPTRRQLRSRLRRRAPFATRHGQQPASTTTPASRAQVLTADPAAIGAVACPRGPPCR